MGTAGTGGPGTGGRWASPGQQDRAAGQLPPRHQGTSLGMATGQGQARPSAHGWVWLSGAHGQAGQCCGELETGPAAAMLGQGLMAPGRLTWGPGPSGP